MIPTLLLKIVHTTATRYWRFYLVSFSIGTMFSRIIVSMN